MKTKEEIFTIWAPDESPWSRWVKPVLFAHIGNEPTAAPDIEATLDVGWCPPPREKVALVLDLPDAEGVLFGLALARRGYRPVPLYNSLPLPFSVPVIDATVHRMVSAVDVTPIVHALKDSSDELARLNIPSDAPPAFLLDANRSGDGRTMQEDEFDDRSVSFTTDFPSANYFAAHGIERVMLIQKYRTEPQPDLTHSLRRWQDAGFTLERKRIDLPDSPERFEVTRPSWYGEMFQRVLVGFGLRRSGSGGFGAWVGGSAG